MRSAALSFARRISLAAAACLSTGAIAHDAFPAASITTRAIEANVYLGDMHADSALAADCLAEGKKWLADNAAEAASELKRDPQLFRDRGWKFSRGYGVWSVVDDRYVSVVTRDYMDTNGAHSNTDINTFLWDQTEKNRISILPFFNETADNGETMNAMLEAVIASLKIEKKKRGASETATAEWFKGIEPKLTRIGAVVLAPSTEAGKSSGLTFHYPPYAVGPYVEGEYVAFVPWETLKPFLTPEGQRIFGGSRPKADAEER